jgi:hypothetical protein
MPFSIDDFKAQLAKNGGLLKNNRFLVRIPTPTILLGRSVGNINTNQTGRILEYYAESVSVPGLSLQTSEIRRQGVGNLEKTPFGAAFTDCNVSFRIDQKSEVWNFFQAWMDTIYNYNISKNTEYELAYKDEYCTTLTIFVYNEIAPQYPALIVDLVDAFPVAISDIALNWGSSDFMRLNVRFNFLTWNERNVGISGGGSSVSTINSNLQVNDPNRQQQTANDTKIASTGRTSVSGQSVVQGSTMDGFAPP